MIAALPMPLSPQEVCGQKLAYERKTDAKQAARRTEAKRGNGRLVVYRCSVADHFHIGHKRQGTSPITCPDCGTVWRPRVHLDHDGLVDAAFGPAPFDCPSCHPTNGKEPPNV